MGPLSESIDTDVLVVGAGPGGSAAAYYLARSGLDVTVVDKAAFPREKVCGDGLTPRGVRAMLRMGVDPDDPGFERVVGLRVYSRDAKIELRWPELDGFPDYGLVRTRHDFDELLVRRAEKAGARVLRANRGRRAGRDGRMDHRCEGPRRRGPRGAPSGRPREVRARGGRRGVALRLPGRRASATRRGRSASPPGATSASSGARGRGSSRGWTCGRAISLLPGYGWLFPVADGTLNIGAGMLNTFKGFKDISAQRLFDAFVAMLPPDWRIGEETAEGRVLSGPLPMGFNRTPVAQPGLLVLGDAAGIVNPFNGEGIAYAMESAEVAAELVHDALIADRPGIAMMYPTVLRERYGRYFSIGRGFARAIGHPAVMRTSTRFLLPNRTVMKFALRVLGNLTDGVGGGTQDKLMYALERLGRAA